MSRPVIHVPLDPEELLVLVGSLGAYLKLAQQLSGPDVDFTNAIAIRLRKRLEEEYGELAKESQSKN